MVGVPEDGVDDLSGIIERPQNLDADERVLLERRMLLVVEVVQQTGNRPGFLVAGVRPRVEAHGRLDTQRVLDEVLVLRVLREQRVCLLARRRCHVAAPSCPSRAYGAG